jgi:hypothetical protein
VDRAVFLNYRGEDSHCYAALLYTELTRHFGEQRVFLDAESIPAGADFVRELLGRAGWPPPIPPVRAGSTTRQTGSVGNWPKRSPQGSGSSQS